MHDGAGVHVVAPLLVLLYHEVPDPLGVLEVEGGAVGVVQAEVDLPGPGVAPPAHHGHLVGGEAAHGERLDAVRRVEAPQRP